MRRIFCSIILLLAFAAPLWSQPSSEPKKTSAEEKRALDYAKRAFQDRLYDVAAEKLEQFLRSYPQSTSLNEVSWLLGQSLYFQGKYEAALAVFQKQSPAPLEGGDGKQTPVKFWEGETLTALKRWPEASAVYQRFLQADPQSEQAPQARLALGYALFQEGRRKDALEILKEMESGDVKNGLVQKAALLRAQILLADGQLSEAKEALNKLIAQKPARAVLLEAAYWMGEIVLKEGKPDDALNSYRKITTNERVSSKKLLSQAWFGTGEAFYAQKDWSEAADAFEKAFRTEEDPQRLCVAMQRFLDCHRENQSLSSGTIRLREFAKETGQPLALYAIGQSFQQAGNTDAAIAELDGLIKTYPNSKWANEAQLLMSNILTNTGETQAAIKILSKLTNKNRDAQFHLAELYFNSGQFAEAAEVYRQIAQSKDKDASLEQALFNAALSFAKAGKKAEFAKTEKSLAEAFPKSVLLQSIALEEARLFEEAGDEKSAREALQKFIQANPNHELLPQAIFSLGVSFYKEGNYAEAAQAFHRVETEFPSSLLVLEATYRRILSEFGEGKINIDAAREQYADLLFKNPNHEMAPSIAFKIAQSYYEQQNFGDAEKAFQKFAEKYSKHALAGEALYYAGRSLMWLTNYDAAIAVFEKIGENSSLKTEARLAEIDCYRQLGKFDAALKIANSLLSSEPNGKDTAGKSFSLEAMLRKANILFTLAGENPSLYEQALQAAEAILASDSANLAQKNEAGFIKGKSLEKLNKPDEALKAYLDVVYGKLFPSTTNPTQPEYRWFTRCGVEAAQMKENAKDIRAAIGIYRILERFAGPNREEFSKKIEDLRTRYFFWEDE